MDKKPLDLYRLKKAVETRGGFDKVCKLKKWAEIGRDLGYSGKIMSSLSTSLKNSYQRWLCPYEDYLRLAKPGVHQQLEQEYGGPLTPSPGNTPMKRSAANTPADGKEASPARQATEALVNGMKKEADADVAMADAPQATGSSGGFKAINNGGFTAVNSGFKSVNSGQQTAKSSTPDVSDKQASPSRGKSEAASPTPSAGGIKRRSSLPGTRPQPSEEVKEEGEEGSSRRSKRLRKENVPTVAGSHITQFKPSLPRIPRDTTDIVGDVCEVCGRGEEEAFVLTCESCDTCYHGICLSPPVKRKPDAEWNCPRCLVGDGEFGFEDGGLYSLKQFQQKANDFKQGYFENKMPYDSALKCHRPVTEEDVENEFWRLVADLEETVEVEYGADIHCTTHGSGFPTMEKQPTDPYSSDPWNLNVLPFHSESLFKHIKSDISGMTVPWVYVGMIFSTFCWHNEDHYAYSANYQHFGATKTWYGIPGEDAEKFEAAMRDAVPELFETQPDLLFQLVTLLTPEQLKKAGVRVYAVDQRAGQLVITFPQAYHAGFNHGFNCNEAVNFAPADWETFGQAGVERLQAFRRQPCFSHDELLCTAADGVAAGLNIQTAKWLAPALTRIQNRETQQRADFERRHLAARHHICQSFKGGDGDCPLTVKVDEEDVLDEDKQCCAYCKAFAYLSRYVCEKTGNVVCILHAGTHPCCDDSEEDRLSGKGHTLIYRKTPEMMEAAHQKVVDKAHAPEVWEQKYDKLLDEEITPSLKSLRALLHEGERVPYDLPSLPVLKEFVDRCNDWVEEATNYIVRKQQNRRKNEKAWQSGMRKSVGNAYQDQKERESRNVSNIYRLLKEADQLGFDAPEIAQLQERSVAIKEFQANAAKALEQTSSLSPDAIEELIEEGRGFNVDTPEVERLARVLDQLRWNDRARGNRGVYLSLNDVEELINEGKRLEIPSYNDHFKFYSDQLAAGQNWEAKARELIHAEFVHYPQLESLSVQAQNGSIPVSQTTLSEVDQILHKQREAHKQILDITERSRDPDILKRPTYVEIVEITKKLEDLNSKPNGTIELENERKRHEDWMRKGKRLFGKSNAPLHILKSHLEYVYDRNKDCFDVEHDTPRMPVEPVSREVTPEPQEARLEDGKHRQVFCICRKIEAGMMIECELCHEWYHYKCLKIARGKVKEDDKYTCPICDWRMKIPRDASRPKLEDLLSLQDEIATLPFQPEEEEILGRIIDNAQMFRDRIARYCNPVLSTKAEAETQRFYLRKLEGAEVLLAYETNFFRQELHKWCPVAPEAPPILEVSLSTRKPRPTKLQKMLVEYGVDNPDDLPEHAKGKANSLRRKAANAEAAAQAAHTGSAAMVPPAGSAAYGAPTYFAQGDGHDDSNSGDAVTDNAGDGTTNEAGSGETYASSRPPMVLDDTNSTLEERLLQGKETDIDLDTESGKKQALEILGRTEEGRKQAEKLWGSDVWQSSGKDGDLVSRDGPATAEPGEDKETDEKVDKMLVEMTNQDEEPAKAAEKKEGDVTAESLENERNDLDAMIDGE